MCGIAGKVSFYSPPLIETVEKMTEKLAHRGPDNGSICQIDQFAVFGHRRLSIIDIADRSNQPMQDNSKRYTIVYNGEVNNFLELNKILKEHRYAFKTNSDTEFVLYSYIHWGVNCFNKFNGMYAIAIWDKVEKTLILARDRFGKKPLYYCLLNNEITFASELSAILVDQKINSSKSVSITGLNHYLAMGYILSPNTIYSEIKKIEPASYAIFKNEGHIQKSVYWKYIDYFYLNIALNESKLINNIFKSKC